MTAGWYAVNDGTEQRFHNGHAWTPAMRPTPPDDTLAGQVSLASRPLAELDAGQLALAARHLAPFCDHGPDDGTGDAHLRLRLDADGALVSATSGYHVAGVRLPTTPSDPYQWRFALDVRAVGELEPGTVGVRALGDGPERLVLTRPDASTTLLECMPGDPSRWEGCADLESLVPSAASAAVHGPSLMPHLERIHGRVRSLTLAIAPDRLIVRTDEMALATLAATTSGTPQRFRVRPSHLRDAIRFVGSVGIHLSLHPLENASWLLVRDAARPGQTGPWAAISTH